jgi:hypothetical protein
MNFLRRILLGNTKIIRKNFAMVKEEKIAQKGIKNVQKKTQTKNVTNTTFNLYRILLKEKSEKEDKSDDIKSKNIVKLRITNQKLENLLNTYFYKCTRYK